MKKYKSASASGQAEMISDYSDLMQQELEMTERVNDMNNSKGSWNTDTAQYWIDLYGRCSKKMLSAL